MRRVLILACAAAILLSGCSAPQSTIIPSTTASAPPQAERVPAYAAPSTPTPSAFGGTAPQAKSETSLSILDDLMFENISAKYRAVAVPLDRSDFDRLRSSVCEDMRQRGSGYFTLGDVSHLSESDKEALARSMWLVMAQSCYPADYVHSDTDMYAMIDFLAELAPEYDRRLTAAGLASPRPGGSTFYSGSNPESSSSGSGGYTSGGSFGSGYSVMCNDGTVSKSGGKSGACSWHGGVSK